MWANNETGVLFPVERIAEICQSRGVLYHCDAVQAAGKVEIDVRKLPADYLSLTGHKFHAPKGIGALYVRRKSPFSPLVYGGHRERNRRGGTESGPLVVGMGKGQLREATPLNNRLTHKRKRGRARRIPGMTQVSKGVPSV
jgi:cysteine desulfurase